MRAPDTGAVEAPAPLGYDDALRDRIRANLMAHRRRVRSLEGHRHAAVAVVLVDSQEGEVRVDPYAFAGDFARLGMPGDVESLDGRMVQVSGGAAFVLCRRAARLNAHAGQWALPGGRVDEGETVEEAALRELDEECGVRLPETSVLGLMDDYQTRSGYVMTPVVIWGGGPLDLVPAPDEVRAVYRIGLNHLLRADSPRFVDIPESDRPVVQVPLGGDLIHAPTGAVLVQLRWLGLEGLDRPVHDFEQPTFAWR